MAGNEKDPLGILEETPASDPLGILESETSKKKEVTAPSQSTSQPQTTTPASNEPVKQPAQPSAKNGVSEGGFFGTLKNVWDNITSGYGVFGATELEKKRDTESQQQRQQLITKAQEQKTVEQVKSEQTKQLKDAAVRKLDDIRADYKGFKDAANTVSFATQYPEYKQLLEVEQRLKEIGEPKTQEQIAAYNALVKQRNTLLDTPVSGRDSFQESAPIIEVKNPSDFETAADYIAYQKGLEKQFADSEAQKKKFQQAQPKYSEVKTLRDVIAVAQGAEQKGAELLQNIQRNQKEADVAIKTARELNSEKLNKLGFGSGFMEGMEQTTLANTVADMLFTGNDDQLLKSLENIYEDALIFPKETTTMGAVGELLGGQVKPLAVGAAGSALNPALGLGGATAYYGRVGAGGALIDAYTTARSQGMSAPEALELAKKQAVAGGIGGLVEGAAGAITFGGKSLIELAKMPFKKAVVEALKDNSIDAAVAGMNQVAQNKVMQQLGLDVETSRGVLENMGAELAFGAGMNLAMYGGSKIKGYGTIINGLAKLPFQDIQAQVDKAVKEGVLDEANANRFLVDVTQSKVAQEKLVGADIPESKEDAVIDAQKQIDILEEQKKTASAAVLPSIENKIAALTATIQVEAGIPLTQQESAELNKLQTARDENKPYDKERLDVLEKRQQSVTQKGVDEANKIATDLGFNNATHLLNKIKKEGLGEFEKVQDVPQDVLESLKTETDAVQEQNAGESVLGDQRIRWEGELQGVEQENQLQQPTQKGQQGKSEEVKPIRQLGTGANVYFETKKYRVNDLNNGKVVLNIGDDADGLVPIANIEFDTAAEAVKVAKKLDELRPNGISREINLESIVEGIKRGEYDNEKALVQQSDLSSEIEKAEVKEPIIQKETPAIIRQRAVNDLLNLTDEYNNMSDGVRGKGSADGQRMKMRLKETAAELGYSILERGKAVTVVNKNGNKVRRSFSEEGNISRAEKFTPLEKRSEKVKNAFGIASADPTMLPTIIGANGKRMSNAQIKRAANDVATNNPTKGAEALLNQLEEMSNNGNVIVFDKILGERAVPFDEYFAEMKAMVESAEKEVSSMSPEEVNRIADEYWDSLTDAEKKQLNEESREAERQFLSKEGDNGEEAQGVAKESGTTNAAETSPTTNNQAEEITVSPDTKQKVEQITNLFYEAKNAEGGSKKRSIAEQRKKILEDNPTLKYIDDNMRSIMQQLEDKGLLTKKGDCP